MISKYKLINQANETFDLNNLSNMAFTPYMSGLGYKLTQSYIRVGNSYVRDNSELAQGELNGTLYFNDYENYQDLITFIENSTALRLIYTPLDVSYYRDIDFRELGSPRINGATIESEITFDCKTLYYTLTDTVFYIEPVATDSTYDLLFDYTFNDYSATSIDVNNHGHVEAELVVEMNGPLLNPAIELLVNGVSIHKVEFAISVDTGEKLIYSARDNDNYVTLVESDGSQNNAVGTLSLANDNFFKLPKGNSTLALTSDSGLSDLVKFRIISLYKGV